MHSWCLKHILISSLKQKATFLQKGKLLILNWVMPFFQHRCYGLCYKIMQLRLLCMAPSTQGVGQPAFSTTEWSAARARWNGVWHGCQGRLSVPCWLRWLHSSRSPLSWPLSGFISGVMKGREVTPARPSCCAFTAPLLPAPVTQLCWAAAHRACGSDVCQHGQPPRF